MSICGNKSAWVFAVAQRPSWSRWRIASALPADVLDRAVCARMAAYALIVDIKDEAAAAFYRHHGVIVPPCLPCHLSLLLAA